MPVTRSSGSSRLAEFDPDIGRRRARTSDVATQALAGASASSTAAPKRGRSLEAHSGKRFRTASPAGRGRSAERHWDAEAIARLRLPTPSPERREALALLPPDEKAGFGAEFDIDSHQLDPPLPRKQALTRLEGSTVECDVSFTDPPVSYIEDKTTPAFGPDPVLETTQALIDFVATIRQAAIDRKTWALPLGSVIPDCEPGIADHDLLVLSRAPVTGIQTTFGVSLADFGELLKVHPDDVVAGLERRVARVAEVLSEACGDDLVSPELKGFIGTIVYYMDEASRTEEMEQTVHARFNFMLRSDFCAIYRKLLTPEDRAMARVLLLPPGDGDDCLFAQALGVDADSRLFGRPYLTPPNAEGGWIAYDGPTLGDFLASIARGPRSLLSPPEGCPDDYGMGLQGVDVENGKLLVEVRERRGRTVTMVNHLLMEQVRREYNFASRFNGEVLGPHDDDLEDGVDADSWAASASEAVEAIGKLFLFYSGGRDDQNLSVDAALDLARETTRNMPVSGVQPFAQYLADHADPQAHAEPRAAMAEFRRVVLEPQVTGDHAAVVDSFERVMRALWVDDGDHAITAEGS